MDDLADIKSALDALYLRAAGIPATRRPDVVAAVLRSLNDILEAEARFERAFGHLVPAAPAQPLHESPPSATVASPPPLPHQMQQPMPMARLHPNPALAEALRRDGT